MEFERLFGIAVDYAYAGHAARRWIENQAVYNAVGTNSEPAGLHRSGKGGIQAAEIRRRDAATVTNTAVVTRGASFVNASEHGGAADGHDPIIEIFRQCVSKILLNAGHLHRRQKFAVGKLRQSFSLPANSGEFLHV